MPITYFCFFAEYFKLNMIFQEHDAKKATGVENTNIELVGYTIKICLS